MTSDCQDEACITCSDQLLRLVVTSVDEANSLAQGIINDVSSTVSVELIEHVKDGDILLCHGGVALQRADAAEAAP